MQEDTIAYDSLAARPMPGWLTARKEGTAEIASPEMKIRDDRTIDLSVAITFGALLIAVLAVTLYLRRKRNNI
jgi:hypothetical protein